MDMETCLNKAISYKKKNPNGDVYSFISSCNILHAFGKYEYRFVYEKLAKVFNDDPDAVIAYVRVENNF